MLPKPMLGLPCGRGRIGKQKFKNSNEEDANEGDDEMASIPIFLILY